MAGIFEKRRKGKESCHVDRKDRVLREKGKEGLAGDALAWT
jgi:hypothetical protein